MAESNNGREVRSTDIAIIGMSCRVPGADNVQQFWENLKAAKESIRFFDSYDLEMAGVPAEKLRDPRYVKAAGWIENVDQFDAAFFGFTPAEARLMDPQRRLFLEVVWEALENAGYDAPSYQGSIGIFGGVGANRYALNIFSNADALESHDSFSLQIASEKDFLATHVAYKLNLRGPSIAVQTACSTSLVAVHLACQSLLAGDCDIVLAGGATISALQKRGYVYQEGGILSPDGHCRAFDSRAQGTVGGNGSAVVVLKRFDEALADGDNVYAVIKGSAINNDGSAKVGYTAPSINGQANVIKAAQAVAGVEPETISYIEAHGTGTSLGDAIEIAALREVFRASGDKRNCCAIGSVKTNLGHLDTAAGVIGLIKTALALKNKQLPASLHFHSSNPKIDLENSPFYVNTELQKWDRGEHPLRAGVSSFGIGGTNAHVVLEEAPPSEFSQCTRESQLLVLSARTETAVEKAATNLHEHLKEHDGEPLDDLAYTLQVGRKEFAHRRMMVCGGREVAIAVLEGTSAPGMEIGLAPENGRGVVFLFPGQGAQFVDMGRGLYEKERYFRQVVDRCCEELKSAMEMDLRDVLYPADRSEKGKNHAEELLKQTAITQPALFVIEYALARLWMEWGVHPEAMIGHSLGEYVAACIAGVLTEKEALNLVAIRGKLMQEMVPGSMLAVGLSEDELMGQIIGSTLSIAAINSPQQCVVSGTQEQIEDLQAEFETRGIRCKRLETSHAFHSQMMEPMLERFRRQVRMVNLRPPRLQYVSSLTGKWIQASEATDCEYWVRHTRQAVRFGAGIQELLKTKSESVLLEVGPRQVLRDLVLTNVQARDKVILLTSMKGPRKDQTEQTLVLNTLGRLWLSGVKIDWAAFHQGERHRRVPLPTYAFDRQRFWIDPAAQQEKPKIESESLDKKKDIADWFYVPVWKQSILAQRLGPSPKELHWLIFLDEQGIGADVVGELVAHGHSVITVGAGKEFSELGTNHYQINPQNSEHYEHLFSVIKKQKRLPQRIVHLWNITAGQGRDMIWQSFQESQYAGFYSLLFLAQAMAKHNVTQAVEITVVSNHLQAVSGEERTSPEKSTVLGPCRVIPQEYPNLSCRNVDIKIPKTEEWQRKTLLKQLMMELLGKTKETIVAYRGQLRWIKTFEPIRLEPQEGKPVGLRENGAYLITGGLGNLGLELAEYLARSARARLILVGRSEFPPEQQWDEWLERHPLEDETARKIKKLQMIRNLGATVLILRADVGELGQMQQVVSMAREQLGEINGIIHAAGVPSTAAHPISELTYSDCEEQFLAKIRGVAVLNFLFKEQLDFCVLFSSLSSVLGGLGFAAYTAANIFMDSFVQERQHKHAVVWTSINWDGWQLSGLQQNQQGMDRDSGIEAFHRILQLHAVPQVAVSATDLKTRLQHWVDRQEKLGSLLKTKSSSASAHYTRPALSSPYAAPTNEIQELLVDLWQRLLGIHPIGIHDDFFELGGNSLLVVQVASRLREIFRIDVPLRLVFECPSIYPLAEAVAIHDPVAVGKITTHLKRIKTMSREEKNALRAQTMKPVVRPDLGVPA